MNPFFAYLIKSSISLAVLYSLFRFVMRNDRSHVLNRFLLLGIMLISAIIPFLNIQFFYKEVAIKQVEVFREFVSTPVFSEVNPQEIIQPVNEASSFSINPWLAFYILIIVALLSRIVFGVIKVTQIIKRAEKRRLQKIVLAVVKDLIQPFTFLNKVVISEKDFTENKDIIVAHEHAHIKHLHALDLMVCEVFTVLHFFNPFMWLLRRDLKLVHEFQADQAVLNKGIDAKKYQLLVLQKSVGERRFAMANHFTQKPILKRIKMMQQKNRKQWAAVKLILFLPLLVILLQAFARPELISGPDDFIPVKYTEDKSEKWLAKWTADNIGKGFYEPELDDINAPRKPNNVLVILMNRNDDFLIEEQRKNKEEIKQIVKNYLLGTNPDGKNGPDYMETEIPGIGKMKVSKGMIVYKHDLASSKEMINYTLRSIGETCLKLRKEKAQILFGKDYFDLDEEKRKAVDQAVPVWFSYESPKSPTPNVWLPFDEKPSKPDPIKITFKGNGNVVVENHKFESLEEFEENLKYWTAELDEFNKDRRSKGFYRADVTYEDISRSEQKNISYILYKNNVHVGHITDTSSKPNLVNLEKDKLQTEYEKNSIKADSLLTQMEKKSNESGPIAYSSAPPSSTAQKNTEKVDVHLNQNKLYFDGKFSTVEDLRGKVEKYIKENPEIKMVRLIVHEPDKLSDEIEAKVKEELNKIKGVEIKVTAVAVMPIKKKTPPPAS